MNAGQYKQLMDKMDCIIALLEKPAPRKKPAKKPARKKAPAKITPMRKASET